MNIWDSVQRGLEKATHEAGRIAKAQRLRATLEGLSKQIETQQGAIIGTAMELFRNGQLTQNELLVLCQALQTSQQQFAQAQNELKLTQNQAAGPTQPNATVAYTQPPYQPYDNTFPSLVPPPPPGVEALTVSSLETIKMAPTTTEPTQCGACHAALVPGNAFCHNCGTPVHSDPSSYQPTIRGNMNEEAEVGQGEYTVVDVVEQSTIRAEDGDQPVQDKSHDGGN